MAIAFVNKTSDGTESTVTSLPLPAFSVTTGNFIAVPIRANTASVSSVTDTAGNTYNLQGTDGQNTVMYYAYNITGNAANVVTVNFISGQSFVYAGAYQFSGILKTADPLDVNVRGNATSPTVTTGAFTTVQANELIFLACQISALHSVWTTTPGMTPLDSITVADSVMFTQYKVVSSIQTAATLTNTNDNTGNGMSNIVGTFKAAPVVPAGQGPGSVIGANDGGKATMTKIVSVSVADQLRSTPAVRQAIMNKLTIGDRAKEVASQPKRKGNFLKNNPLRK